MERIYSNSINKMMQIIYKKLDGEREVTPWISAAHCPLGGRGWGWGASQDLL